MTDTVTHDRAKAMISAQRNAARAECCLDLAAHFTKHGDDPMDARLVADHLRVTAIEYAAAAMRDTDTWKDQP